MNTENHVLKVNIEDTKLDLEGFTSNGKTRFKKTIRDYSSEIFKKSIAFGDISCGKGMKREVTHEHVKRATVSIAGMSLVNRTKWSITGQIFEYIFAIVVGVTTNHLDKQWGIIVFTVSVAVGLLLVVIRLFKSSN